MGNQYRIEVNEGLWVSESEDVRWLPESLVGLWKKAARSPQDGKKDNLLIAIAAAESLG